MRFLGLAALAMSISFSSSAADLAAENLAKAKELLDDDRVHAQATKQLLATKERLPELDVGREFGSGEFEHIQFNRIPRYIDGTEELLTVEGFRFKIPELKSTAEFTWYFEAPKGLAGWRIVDAETGNPVALTHYAHPKNSILQRAPVMDTRFGAAKPNFKSGREYLAVFILIGEEESKSFVGLSVLSDYDISSQILFGK